MDNENAQILIVDDEKNVLAFFHAFLTREGYTCDLAMDGREAFRKANRYPYRLVIMDIRMPNWDGVDAIVSLGLVNPDLRVLVISGNLTPDIIEELQSATNVVGWMEKPVDLKRLREMVYGVIQARKHTEVS